MPTEHRDVDVDAELRAFAVALEAHTAEPIRPGHRRVDEDGREPVVVEPVELPSRPDRRRWLLPAVAAAAVAVALVAGLVVLTDDTTPTDTPPSTITTPPTTTTPSTTVPSATTTPPTTAVPVTTVVGAAGATVVPEVVASQLAPELGVPEPGLTQSAIIGDITWTRLQSEEALPEVEFVLDGVFYGSVSGADQSTTWWTSTDGINWDEFGDVPDQPSDFPDQPSGVRLREVGGALWAETSYHWPEAGSDVSVYRWDGNAFMPVELPLSEPVPGEGLAIRDVFTLVAGGFRGHWIIERTESFGVPWTDLLGIERPSVADTNTRSWTGSFAVDEQQCNYGWSNYDCDPSGGTWQIRPELIDDEPTRIDLYDAATGDLLTSIVPPDDLLAVIDIEDLVDGLGRYNVGGGRTETFIVNDDGDVVATWSGDAGSDGPPWVGDQLAELDGRLYALSGGNGIERRLWVSSDLETWDAVPLPLPVVGSDGWLSLMSDGSTMILEDGGPTIFEGGPTIYVTHDGRAWASVTKPFDFSTYTGWLGPADFGWTAAGDTSDFDPGRGPRNESPALAVSADGATWQLIPVPLPAALTERGLNWSDTDQAEGEPFDFDLFWDWEASADGDTIFITLQGEQQQEIWIGRVDTS